MKPRFATLTALVFIAALSRLIPHPWNFTPIAAMALFGGAQFADKRAGFLVPLLAVLVSDIALGFSATVWANYVAFAVIVVIGWTLRQNKTASRVVLASLSASVSFFFITNFAHWVITEQYAKSTAGLVQCFAMAVPFFRNTLLGDLFYTGVLFGSFALVERRFPRLQAAQAR